MNYLMSTGVDVFQVALEVGQRVMVLKRGNPGGDSEFMPREIYSGNRVASSWDPGVTLYSAVPEQIRVVTCLPSCLGTKGHVRRMDPFTSAKALPNILLDSLDVAGLKEGPTTGLVCTSGSRISSSKEN